jgi:hypothetical protein
MLFHFTVFNAGYYPKAFLKIIAPGLLDNALIRNLG